MKVTVTVKTNSKKEELEVLPDGSILVRIRVPPIEGRANERIRELLSEHFNVAKSSVMIVSGIKAKKKIFEIKGSSE